MIPNFPKFTPLSIDTKYEFDQLTANFEPYAEFSFACPYAWDRKGIAEVSRWNQNIILKMPDYATSQPVYSILGKTDIDELLANCIDLFPLVMVPEVTIRSLKNIEKYKIEESREHFDYIYTTFDQAYLPGKHLKNRRVKSGKYYRDHDSHLEVKLLKPSDPSDAEMILEIHKQWVKEKSIDTQIAQVEQDAVSKLIKSYSHFDLIIFGIFHDNACVGFSINEAVQLSYAICRFQKCLKTYKHTDAFLTNVIGIEMLHRGYNYISWEQDLGSPGLREFKMSYHPTKFLRKYTIELLK